MPRCPGSSEEVRLRLRLRVKRLRPLRLRLGRRERAMHCPFLRYVGALRRIEGVRCSINGPVHSTGWEWMRCEGTCESSVVPARRLTVRGRSLKVVVVVG